MHCFSHQEKTKITCNNCIKIVPSLFKDACAHFRVSSCLDSPSLSSEHEEESLTDIDIDYENMMILEIKNRAMKAKTMPTNYVFTNNLQLVLSPTKEKLLIASNVEDNVEEAENDNSIEEESQSEVFYSVKSNFSLCSSEKESNWYRDYKGRLIWEDFLHCEGWPFGLCKKVLMLPPLPDSPLDSWTWSKKNINAKA